MLVLAFQDRNIIKTSQQNTKQTQKHTKSFFISVIEIVVFLPFLMSIGFFSEFHDITGFIYSPALSYNTSNMFLRFTFTGFSGERIITKSPPA